MPVEIDKSSLADGELIRSCKEGEQQAWADLIQKYQRLIYSVAHRLCDNQEDCADVFQRVCMELYQSLDTLRSEQTLPAWLITVTRRTAWSVLRNRRPTVSLDEFDAATDSEIRLIEDAFTLEQAVASLPDRCRHLIESLYLDGDSPSYEDVARRLGMPASSIGPTRARCLEKLKKQLES
jgi:RNA polymerase sigma factor (sigma-70 family)